ncbi:MAG: histidine phosphatase family protein [Betaproteobacteria bacterium]
MDLILWRHADAAPGSRDLERKLTARGRKQADRVGAWLVARLPGRYTVLASPARRARETADALGVRYKIAERLAPGAAPGDILEACGWPSHKAAVVVVGHQPDLGRVAAMLVAGAEGEWSVKKGGLWWLSNRERGDETQVVVRAVLAPDLT